MSSTVFFLFFLVLFFFFFFFFFQAEDGIRDRNVTGVQTCALPISARSSFVYHGAVRSAAAEQRDHHALEDGQCEPTNLYWGGRNQLISSLRLQPPPPSFADAGEPADRRDFREGSAPGARIGQARAQRRAQ